MNILTDLLKTEKKDLLSLFFTAGHPVKDSVLKLLPAIEKAGVDFAEVGFPFSDPLADGPIIQKSSQEALDNGMTLNLLFEQLNQLKGRVKMPYLLMGYINPFLQFGEERFCKTAADAGASGVIIPDISPEVFEKKYKDLFAKHNLHFIHLITPITSEQRVRHIDELSTAFIYAVSSSSTTGNKQAGQGTEGFLKRLAALKLNHPIITGFGIRTAEQFKKVCSYTRGGIVGSALVEKLKKGADLDAQVIGIVKELRGK